MNRNTLIQIVLLLTLLLCASSSVAQRQRLLLSDGSVLLGAVHEVNQDTVLLLRSDGSSLLLPQAAIQESDLLRWRHELVVDVVAGQNFRRRLNVGGGLSYRLQYQLSDRWSLAAGAGFAYYEVPQQLTLIPIMLEGNYLFLPEGGWYGNLAAGYSLGVNNEVTTNALGGTRYAARIGKRWLAPAGVQLKTEIGFLRQAATYDVVRPWSIEVFQQQMVLHRWQFRFGVLF